MRPYTRATWSRINPLGHSESRNTSHPFNTGTTERVNLKIFFQDFFSLFLIGGSVEIVEANRVFVLEEVLNEELRVQSFLIFLCTKNILCVFVRWMNVSGKSCYEIAGVSLKRKIVKGPEKITI